MRAIFPASIIRGRLPATIADDLRLIVPGGHGVQLTPAEARALGCRLIRQADVADIELIERRPAPSRSLKRSTKGRAR